MKYDVAIIGGGPGGYVAAIRAGRMGLKTVLFEKETVGGVCLNKGCIPTKALLKSSQICWQSEHSSEHGLKCQKIEIDFTSTAQRKDTIVSSLVSGIKGLLKNSGVEVIKAEAELLEGKKIRAGETTWESKNIIIATGSKPARPSESTENVFTSDEFLSLKELPKSIVIVGGGVIGVEFANMLAGFGCRVSVLEMTDRLVPSADEDVSLLLQSSLEARGIHVFCGAAVTGYHPHCVTFQQEGVVKEISCEATLISVGRVPNVDTMVWERLGIQCDHEKIKVNAEMETSVNHIYAIGDVVEGPMLAHKASAEALVAVEAIAGRKRRMRYDRIPHCVYTQPEAAWIGMSAREAQENVKVKMFTFPTSFNGKSLAEGETEGFVRLIAHRDTGELLGAQVVCAHASELIGIIGSAMQSEACVEDLEEIILPHPSVSESIGEAAAGICEKSIHTMF